MLLSSTWLPTNQIARPDVRRPARQAHPPRSTPCPHLSSSVMTRRPVDRYGTAQTFCQQESAPAASSSRTRTPNPNRLVRGGSLSFQKSPSASVSGLDHPQD